MSTGLVATQTIAHATPASFGSHVDAPPGVKARSCQSEIARQYVTVTQPDVLLGGGRSRFAPSAPDVCGVMGNYIAEAQSRGYA